MSAREVTVAVLGASGAVGEQILRNLEKRNFPVKALRPLASKRSAGKSISFQQEAVTIQEATPEAFAGVDIALFSAGGGVSEHLAPEAVKRGAVVIDNTTAFRMNKEVPLIVPEVNAHEISNHKGIIANPNCSTIQMVVALKPLYDQFGFERVIVSTYQAVSGSGAAAMEELKEQAQAILEGREPRTQIMPVGKLDRHYPLAFNVIPQCDVAEENGFTLEEMKMTRETKKIFGDDNIGVTATCVRVPVLRGHSESIYVELQQDFTMEEIVTSLRQGEGIVLENDLHSQIYPIPLSKAGQDGVFVGRVRRDTVHPRGLNLWVVSDNLLKGAATNAVQIAEYLL